MKKMKKIMCAKGTPEQFLQALEDRISELESGDVYSSEDVESGCISSGIVDKFDEVTYDTVQASYDDNYEDWVELASKQVKDSDGFYTDYTLYEYQGDPDDVDGEVYICMFGDKELYEPSVGYSDWSGETEEEAWDWFDNYEDYQLED